ncbi:NAD(P)-dependent dehydrogenase, short-chain alcohol dehydrogenase family [Planococcus glaciei]|uniref:SDR family NAD(P)-dependent oxidoreductase n=1 Tax=Planococcus glaciei TaxID=459472 RepID=UPI0008829F2B|nr:glucose 1-dehydrogenase [Planococcus glaciei]SDG74367.1 NAD(P)-dependent dehydrogenase, short-chain alcohol dehydrogenase family [Planococcus glaciei]
MNKLMEGKAGLVTGAGSGIGRGSALAFAQAGAKVMVSDKNEDSGKETVRLIQQAGGTAAFFRCDVSNEDDVKALVDEAVAEFGRLDFAHNNAGITAKVAPIAESDSADFDRVIQTNLYGTYYSMKHEVRAMLKTGGGAIVNTSSGAGLEGVQNMIDYVASKFGINGMTKTAALEYSRHGIRVNAICPGLTATLDVENWFAAAPEQAKAITATLPSGKLATPNDVGNAAVFLCSDLAGQINGVTLPIDGGFSIGKFQG